MDREINDFEIDENNETPLKGFGHWSCTLHLKTYSKTSRGIILQQRSAENNFFKPFIGLKKPTYLFFSVREINNKRFMFIDEVQPPNEGLVKFIGRNPKRPNCTHSTDRKITATVSNSLVTSIACQVIGLMPEIIEIDPTTKKMEYTRIHLTRVPIEGHPDDVRYQCVFLP